ncbi:putative protein kinase RLK-Pelle-SD-2b family [Rosa chinensis]|uniref:non-specific serine/threonine protein kinase n=1 Tax=Rosa chinensis TaxID=74649 RepID=A0A2P6PXU7_ROSCH|nr:putative protein kinase RLK-Pelle-SD-2b family [Rosa chinensis]
MANGSLDKWIFKKTNEECLLDWETRFSTALGTAKGLAYLHEGCDSKIIHCDIKPQNVLLDNNYHAKVSRLWFGKANDQGAARAMFSQHLEELGVTLHRSGSQTRLSVGRKNYDQSESSEKSQFPSYAFKMLKEGKMKDIVDSKLKITAIIVALWRIQQDMCLRPSMIVQIPQQ